MRETYEKLIGMLNKYGTVLTEHIADPLLIQKSEMNQTDSQIYEQDTAWLEEADVVIAEVSNPSLGVGFEIGYALKIGKPILCLFNKEADKKLSAMISGCHDIQTILYLNIDELKEPFEAFLSD